MWALGTKFDTLAVTRAYRPLTSLPTVAIVSAKSTMPSKSIGRSPGSPHMKYSLTLSNPFWNATRAAFDQVAVLDLLANLFTHVVAGDFGGQRHAAATIAAEQNRQRAKLLVDSQARHADVHAQRLKDFVQSQHQWFKVWIVAAGKRQDADFVEASVLVALQRRVDDRVDFANSQRSFDDGALTKATKVRTATHDLDGDPVVDAFDVGNDRLGRQRDAIQITDHTWRDRLGNVGASSIE